MSNRPETVAQDYDALLDECLAHAVAEGDIVNFRLLFMPASPFREDSPEDASTPKYDYLFRNHPMRPGTGKRLAAVSRPEIGRFVREQLARKGPPRLPWQLLLALGDNAARLGKYTAASQAYELLRVRRRFQDLTLDKADAQLRQGNIQTAVKGYGIALGLQYDYGAFPEPLPAVPDYQERAPALHQAYPATPEQTLALQDDEVLCRAALGYLLPFKEFSGRFQQFEPETLVPFTAALIRALDEDWDAFAAAFKDAERRASAHQSLFNKLNSYTADVLEVLAEEVLEEGLLPELRAIPGLLTNAPGENREWWHYVKVMAFRHPGAPVFVARQRLSANEEIIVPRYRQDSELAKALGLAG